MTVVRCAAHRRRERAQSTVELALLLPVVILLLLAALQVGLLGRDVLLVTHASREAARAAAVEADPGTARRAAIASSGLAPDRVQVRVSGRDGPGSRVRVMVSYRAPTNVPIVGRLLGDRTLRATVTMRVEGS
ncbi:MAG: TadE/TadG family type IV pilus assembly protein [Acidimicrobiales bacterium]